MKNIDCSSIRTVRVHKDQFDAIEKKADDVIITCIEDGRCVTFTRDKEAEEERVTLTKEEIVEVKSLRWLANMFPYTENPQDNTDKMSNAIHLYCTASADKIEELQSLLNINNTCS